jgi:hypothetical protein
MDSASSSDLCWGARAIADVIERSERITFYMLESGALPARKVGGRWVASKARLLAHCRGDDTSDRRRAS